MGGARTAYAKNDRTRLRKVDKGKEVDSAVESGAGSSGNGGRGGDDDEKMAAMLLKQSSDEMRELGLYMGRWIQSMMLVLKVMGRESHQQTDSVKDSETNIRSTDALSNKRPSGNVRVPWHGDGRMEARHDTMIKG